MELRIEIVGDRIVCLQNGTKAFAASLSDFLAELGERGDWSPLPEAIPEGVRFVRRRGDVVVLVIEERPQLRTIRWLADESAPPFGKGALYRRARLAFPFVVAVIAFRKGALTGYQQCFYRTEAIGQLSDALFLPNLYNVADGYGLKCWLCLAGLGTDLDPLTWNDKVRELRKHLWGAAFNRSSEMHEGMSYWTAMRGVDPRFDTIDAWERASRDDAFFPLGVSWKPSGMTLGDAIGNMLSRLSPPPPTTAAQLAHILSLVPRAPAPRRTLLSRLAGAR
jgi:hypothetical protein